MLKHFVKSATRIVTPIRFKACFLARRAPESCRSALAPTYASVLPLIRRLSTTRNMNDTDDQSKKTPSDSKETVSFDLVGPKGIITKVHVHPSYPHKPKAIANLIAALPELVTGSAMPVGPVTSFSAAGWDLDESGDTIHRYTELKSPQDVALVLDAIKAASAELNHDPHVHIDENRLTISCTTHVPPGLSMKDVKLARKIDEILDGAGHIETESIDEAEILSQRQRAREHNMAAARKAKLSCACG